MMLLLALGFPEKCGRVVKCKGKEQKQVPAVELTEVNPVAGQGK